VSEYTVWSYGGGEQLWYVFNAVATIFKHNEYSYAFYIAATLFGIWVLITSIVSNKAMVPIKWMFWFWLSTTLMLAPKTDIMISDPVTKFEKPVGDVPWVLGMSAGIISGIGHSMTDLVETFFSLPDYQSYGGNGMMFASKILKNMDKYRIRNGVLKENMSRFIEQCVVLEAMMGGKYTVKDLKESKNIWELVSTNANPINGFSYRDEATKHTDIVTCKEGVTKLATDLKKETKAVAGYLGRRNMPNRDKTTSEVVFENYFNEKLISSYQFMSGIAENAESILKQEMMINAIEDVSLNYAASKAAIQQRAWYLTTGELASGFLIGLKVVMDCLAYGGFIFIAIMVMLPTGINILGKYLQILIWLQLWAPLYAILNMVMSTVAQYKTQGIIGNDGLSMMTSVGLTTLQGNIEAIAAFCTSSIPFISYSLMQGGVGSFMHLAGTMTSGISGAASAASNEVSSGNLALNSVSYGGRAMMNVAGFKHDMGLSYKSGRMDMERFDGSQGFMTGAGRSGVIAGEGMNMSRLPDKMNISRAIDSGFSSSISKERSAAANFSEQYEEAKAMSVNNSKGLLESMSRNVGQSRGWQVSESSRYADSINKTAQFTKSLQEDKGYSAKQAAEISLSLGGKIFGFGAGSSFSSQGSYDEAVKEGKSLAESQGVTKHLEVGTSHLKDVRYNEGSGEDKKLTENLEISLNQMERYSNMANIHNAIADRISDQKQTAERLGIGVNEDITEQFVDYVANRKMVNGEVYGRDKAIQVLADPDKTADKGILVQEFANKVSSDLIPGFRKSDIINNMDAGYKAEHQKGKVGLEQEVMNRVVDSTDKEGNEKPPEYGTFNQEQGNIKQGKPPAKKEAAYEKTGDNLITKSETAEENNLAINKKLDSDKVKDAYQLYTPEGGDKNNKVNIVDNTRSEIQNVGDKVTQQQNAIDNQKVKLQDNYKEEANTSRIQKATDAVDGVIEKAVEGAGIDYTTRKEAKNLPPFKVDQASFVTMSKEERVEAVKSSVSQSFLETQGLKFPNQQQEAGTTIPYNSNNDSANQSSSIEKGSIINQESTAIGPQLGNKISGNNQQLVQNVRQESNGAELNTTSGDKKASSVDSEGFVNLARPKQSVGPKTFAEEKKDEEEKLQNANNINEAVNLKSPQSEGISNGHLTNIKPQSKESQLYDLAQSNLSTENSYKYVDRGLPNTERLSNITNDPVNNEKPVQSINQEAITGAIKHDSKVISNQQPLVTNITSNIGDTTNDKQLPQTMRQESGIAQSNTAGSSKEVSAINEGFVESTNKIKSQQSSLSTERNNIPSQNIEKSWIEEEFDKPKPQIITKTVSKGSTSIDEGMKKDLEAMKKLTENN
jgi:conjugal transfer mating pair stabilization protein TraG